MKKKTKVTIGVPYYGRQEAEWWTKLVNKAAGFSKMDLEYGGLAVMTTSMTDRNRNTIAEMFLETDSEWLFFIDTDTIVPDGTIRRLLDMDVTLASGLYYGKGQNHPPIAYIRIPETGLYRPLDKVYQWERGEILPVDAAGAGCLLIHRTVFEDIKKNYVEVQRVGSGGVYIIHNDDIRGKIVGGQVNNSDNLVIQGQHRVRVMGKTFEKPFPYFICEYGRTEDMHFFEVAKRVGHQAYLDTSIECGHLRTTPFTGKDYREARLHERRKEQAIKTRNEILGISEETESS